MLQKLGPPVQQSRLDTLSKAEIKAAQVHTSTVVVLLANVSLLPFVIVLIATPIALSYYSLFLKSLILAIVVSSITPHLLQ